MVESPEGNCTALAKNVLIQQLHLPAEIVYSMRFCGANRLGKQNANKTIVCFTCRSDRELVWKNLFHLKDSPVAIGEDFPKHIQDISSTKIKKENPRAEASVIGNRRIVNGKRYFQRMAANYNTYWKWFKNQYAAPRSTTKMKPNARVPASTR